MLTKILGALSGGLVKEITSALLEAYKTKKTAETTELVVEADKEISYLEAQRDIILREQDRILTSWIRPAFAGLALIVWAKLLIWDTVLGLGVTPAPGELIEWFLVLIPGAYFVARPFEKVFRKG